MEFKLSTATIEAIGGRLVSVDGELDISTTDRLAEATRAAVAPDSPLVVDLSLCSFIDSTGLRFLLHTHKALAEDGQAMAVVVGDGHVRQLLSTTGIDLSVRVFPGIDQAVAFLSASTESAEPGRTLPAATSGDHHTPPPIHEQSPA